MRNYRTIFFQFISLLILVGCVAAPPSHIGQVGTVDRDCFRKFVPNFQAQWYKATVDVTGKHFGGLLLFKTLADGSIRTVFTNEGGATYFDFGFGPGQNKVYFALPQFDKRPVIKTLQNDLELVLMQYERDPKAELFVSGNSNYLKVSRGKKTVYLVASGDCRQLDRVEQEWGGSKKVEVKLNDYPGGVPDSISISHFNFNMNINLKKLQR